MALEVISQILSPTNATYINGVSAERRFSAAVLKNMYQGLVEKGGRGIDDKFVSEDDATSSAQVFVNRILPVKKQPREQGASKNGASFSANKHYTQTVTVGIELLQVLDDPIIIPRARQDMIKVDLLAEQTKIYSDRLATIINGATFAAKVLTSMMSDAKGKGYNGVYMQTSQILKDFITANSLLDEGDEENGVDLFPEETRVAVFKPSYRATLKTSGVLVLGGANYAYDIAKGDAISQGASARRSEDGYIGDIDGVPCHIISNESLRHADGFLGFMEGDLKASDLVGYISSSYANSSGVSTSKQIKVVDAVDGQGLILQPYNKFGVASWYPKGNVMLTASDGFNPFKSLSTIFSSSLSSIVFKLKGAGSRLFPEISISSPGATGATFSIEAEDDWNTGHVVAAVTCVSDAPATSVCDFLKKYAAATYKGVVTITGGAASSVATTDLTVGDGKYINCLAISDDGSMSVESEVKPA